ncbi:MAG: histidine--tRNA ligase [Phycisphaerales bacterium JB054]
MTAPSKPEQTHKIQPPRGTRDLYPAEAARRRWLTERWREVSVRHGFEEVDGPTFEASDLYAVKSGDGILGELFQAFSGKSPDEVEQVRETGRAPYALRPEFTPTLARMYAAKAAGLPKPCKWFMAGPFFRAERPQRGRLREFLQWNVDLIGGEVGGNLNDYDAEVMAVLASALEAVGLTPEDVRIKVGSRRSIQLAAQRFGVPKELCGDELSPALLQLLDDRAKITPAEYERRAVDLGLPEDFVKYCHPTDRAVVPMDATSAQLAHIFDVTIDEGEKLYSEFHEPGSLCESIHSAGIAHWCEFDSMIVRGLAYYTSNVFEAIADGERAVAGGGRYDNLIELFGGPKTPAVGFAMGDVVLSLLLQDKGLMPSDDELMGLVGQHPDVFVLSNGDEAADAQVRPTVAALRRGSESLSGLHVRHSYKATKNVGKLLKEAAQQGARFAVIIEDAGSCSVKDTRTNEQWPDKVPLTDLHARIAAAM